MKITKLTSDNIANEPPTRKLYTNGQPLPKGRRVKAVTVPINNVNRDCPVVWHNKTDAGVIAVVMLSENSPPQTAVVTVPHQLWHLLPQCDVAW